MDDPVECRCGKECEFREMEQVYDDQGIYAGRFCCYECAAKHLNLHMTRSDYAESGENLDGDY